MKKFFLIILGFSIYTYADFSRVNGVVTDSRTKLQWQDDTLKVSLWKNAMNYCENLDLDGGGWRLPNVIELTSIVDESRSSPAISQVFIYVKSYYWTSTTYTGEANRRFTVIFNELGIQSPGNEDNNFFVRCVRGGK